MMRTKMRNSKGFTLSELLTCVALILIVSGLLTPALLRVQKNLRQKELDSKAEMIYMAVQNRLTGIYTSGMEELYDPQVQTDIQCLGKGPGDYIEGADYRIREDSVYYLKKDSAAAQNIVSGEVLDAQLNGETSHWVIELIPYSDRRTAGDSRSLSLAVVYAVFYSEGEMDISEEYTAANCDQYRSGQEHADTGAQVGYYGGSRSGS